ncbi:glycosyltransferase family 2 protein [Pseudoalteromonas sp. R86517]|uniref:glycosyltransferase family 2 protein n=1 Tax=Pseudoalteromonas sp. R86517 TaxID=3093857 RepID=UPI0036728030
MKLDLWEIVLISVIVPCTDRVMGLEKCLKSILNQNVSCDFEILLIENNSFDREVVKDLIKSLHSNMIKHHYLDKCENANVARNYGAYKSCGKYIAYLDADDWWAEDHLDTCLNACKKGAKAVYSGFVLDNGERQVEKYSRAIKDETAYHFLFNDNKAVAQTSSFFLSKDIFNSCKWDEKLNRSQDYDFFIEVQKKIGWSYKPKLTVYVYWEIGAKRSLCGEAFETFYNKHSPFMTNKEISEYLCEIVKAYALVSKEEYHKFSRFIDRYRNYLDRKNSIIISNYYITLIFYKLKVIFKL